MSQWHRPHAQPPETSETKHRLTHSPKKSTPAKVNLKYAIAQYLFNVWIAIDQFANVMSGGDPDETISSRLGRIKKANHGRIPWTRPVAHITDALLEWIDPGHSIHSIEDGHGGSGIVDVPLKHDLTPVNPMKQKHKTQHGAFRPHRYRFIWSMKTGDKVWWLRRSLSNRKIR